MTSNTIKPKNITVSNFFGNFKNGEELVSHFCKIWGESGLHHAWAVYIDASDEFDSLGLTYEQYPELFSFRDSLFDALER